MNPRAWFLAARPKTLSAAVAPVIVGTALAYRDRGEVLWFYAALALAGGLLIQIATNFINDAIDQKSRFTPSLIVRGVRIVSTFPSDGPYTFVWLMTGFAFNALKMATSGRTRNRSSVITFDSVTSS